MHLGNAGMNRYAREPIGQEDAAQATVMLTLRLPVQTSGSAPPAWIDKIRDTEVAAV